MAANEEATTSQNINHVTMVTCNDQDINPVKCTENLDRLSGGVHLEQAEEVPTHKRYAVNGIKNVLYNQRGLFYILLSSLFFALLGVCVQLSTAIHEMEAGFVRGIFLLFFSVLGIIIGNIKFVFSKKVWFWITVNGCLNTFAQIGSFVALNLTTVGDATAIMYSMPAFSGVMAWIFLKEPLTLLDVTFTVLCIIGVFLVSQPDFIFGSEEEEGLDTNFICAMWAFAALLSLAVVCIVTRKLRHGSPTSAEKHSSTESCNALILTLAQGIITTVTCAILNTLIGKWCVTKDVAQLCYALGIGMFGFLGIYFYNLSLKRLKALVVSVVFTSCIFMTYIFQFAIFHVYPGIISGLGIVLMLSSVFGVLINDWKKERKLARSYATVVEQSTML